LVLWRRASCFHDVVRDGRTAPTPEREGGLTLYFFSRSSMRWRLACPEGGLWPASMAAMRGGVVGAPPLSKMQTTKEEKAGQRRRKPEAEDGSENLRRSSPAEGRLELALGGSLAGRGTHREPCLDCCGQPAGDWRGSEGLGGRPVRE